MADTCQTRTGPNGHPVFGFFASSAELEHELIAERPRADQAAACAWSRNGGRPRKMDRQMLAMAMRAVADLDNNAGDLIRRLGISSITLATADGSPARCGPLGSSCERQPRGHKGAVSAT